MNSIPSTFWVDVLTILIKTTQLQSDHPLRIRIGHIKSVPASASVGDISQVTLISEFLQITLIFHRISF
jgi:hypothetical protein